MQGNRAERFKQIFVNLTSECCKLSVDTDLKDSVLRIVNGGQEHVNTWNDSIRHSCWGIYQQKVVITRSQTVHDVDTSAVSNAMSKMIDSVRKANNIESSYMSQIRECLEKCKGLTRIKQETIEGYERNIADLENKIRIAETAIKTLQREATEFNELADRLDDRARELDNKWWFTKIATVVIGALLVTLTAGLILTVAAVAFLGNFNLNTASGCRDGAREARQKAKEKGYEIARLRSNVQAYQGEVTELQEKIPIVKADIDTINRIERELINLIQEIESLDIQRSSDHVLGMLQFCAVRLTHVEADSQLQDFKVEWTTMERQLTECSMPFSDFIF
ncbi:uncharacterized protein LOC127861980 [Dreissena polymorpha]|uniref:Uncharacterized protein n=1 Tax=Dreissena polymorpha TaxID=45954 RepID=A0A9D3YC32_DREPO|nr:uncharacterized protein LOC127861980 [Dreissena polymorpha]KAH3697623.1 hypothetical protein DPMN_085128 [Dreissena polymorpha]